ncbi:chemotaxis protein CheD [Geoalkalibacter halelectricus]|uniref:Probable chemoreceptor glutamine deamidase CheD n=1 Tax=Geoalkalibacter halelectricus TaxID=2847045 RepID=A0ABY5ZNR8_9BACT|nr:chemotaxis protein CheD [Geoalkalibacter halelectricus]MDO3378392.1 chemotaxis protein CheD [Geoalkalibacter halelectricus]UWZ80288.1 chemotaxis protein CheD [Geoalkalibacter halelectricus]
MSERRRVGISELHVAHAPDTLVTYGLGSCLSITLYDPLIRCGGMAHTLLPAPRPGRGEARPGKFVATAVQGLLAELLALGARRERLQAKLVGGANMFENLLTPNGDLIGERNTETAREILGGLGIALVAEDVGGNYGRTAELVLNSGEVRVKSVRGPSKFLIL